MHIALLGAGRVASVLAPALARAGHRFVGVCTRSPQSAAKLIEHLGPHSEALPVQTPEALPEADLYLLCTSDDALPTLAARLAESRPRPCLVHTAGSVPLDLLAQLTPEAGVLYPLQTFTPGRPLDIAAIPFYTGATTPATHDLLRRLVASLGATATPLDSTARARLHLAAVFGCNFVNHLYALAGRLMDEAGLPFSHLVPLLQETADKVSTIPPEQAQTGPALRFDRSVMQAQLRRLDRQPYFAEVYRLLSDGIHRLASQPAQHHSL